MNRYRYDTNTVDAGRHTARRTPRPRRKGVGMIRTITVDGEDALHVDTAEELGRALLSGRYIVASHDVLAEYGITDTDNSDTQEIVDGADWRGDTWRTEGGN